VKNKKLLNFLFLICLFGTVRADPPSENSEAALNWALSAIGGGVSIGSGLLGNHVRKSANEIQKEIDRLRLELHEAGEKDSVSLEEKIKHLEGWLKKKTWYKRLLFVFAILSGGYSVYKGVKAYRFPKIVFEEPVYVKGNKHYKVKSGDRTPLFVIEKNNEESNYVLGPTSEGCDGEVYRFFDDWYGFCVAHNRLREIESKIGSPLSAGAATAFAEEMNNFTKLRSLIDNKKFNSSYLWKMVLRKWL